jgi:hypothetical protein
MMSGKNGNKILDGERKKSRMKDSENSVPKFLEILMYFPCISKAKYLAIPRDRD